MAQKLSAVIPIHNEAAAVSELHRELRRALGGLGLPYEIIYVDDGSTDDSLLRLKALEGALIIRLNRNYGQATALDAGLKAATGDIIITLDGDGQNDPADIPKLISRLDERRLDVVAGWRKNRKDTAVVRSVSMIGRVIRRIFMRDTIHDAGCGLRVYRAEAAKSLDLGGEMHRYVLALLRWKGFKVGEIEVNDRPRLGGKSHYGAGKAVRGFIDLVYVWFIHKYSQRPIHFFGYLSILSLAAAMASGLAAVYQKINFGLSLSRNGWFFIALFLLLFAVLFFSFGIAIDLLVRNYFAAAGGEKRYYIREVVDSSAHE